MVRIWAKTAIEEEKLTRSIIFECEGEYREKSFEDYLMRICHTMDIPTPVVMKHHSKNFTKFNITRFKSNDFIESVDFDVLVLENAADKED